MTAPQHFKIYERKKKKRAEMIGLKTTSTSIINMNVEDIDGINKGNIISKISEFTGKINDLQSDKDNSEDGHMPSYQFPNLFSNVLKSGIDKLEAVTEVVHQPGNYKPTSIDQGGNSFTKVVTNVPVTKKVNFRTMSCNVLADSDIEVEIPRSSVEEVSNRLNNSLYGYFIGKRLAFPVVENYVWNAWRKFGLQKIMMNAKGFFFFKFLNMKGVEDVLENGPWMIRGVPIILNKWTPSVSLTKEDLSRVPVWVKMHDVPITAFTADGLSMIATKLGTPMMLDTYTSNMCVDSWGRSSYARAMIEIPADRELKESVVIGVPNLDGPGFIRESVRLEYEWQPPRCANCKIFGHDGNSCPKSQKVDQKLNEKEVDDGFTVPKKTIRVDGIMKGVILPKMKQKLVYRPVKQNDKKSVDTPVVVSTSNPFSVLEKENDSVQHNDDAKGSTANSFGILADMNDDDVNMETSQKSEHVNTLNVSDSEEEDLIIENSDGTWVGDMNDMGVSTPRRKSDNV